MESEKKYKLGLALGSGGVRGISHIGIIKVLLKNKIPIDMIAGASAGSLVGAYLAVHGEIKSLENLLLKDSRKYLPIFFDLGLKEGIVKGNKIDKFIEDILNKSNFEDTKIKFTSVATDLISGQQVVFSSGNLSKAVMSSISIPIIFDPVIFQKEILVDGGLSNPVPVDLLRQNGIDKVIAVNLYHKNEFTDKKFTISNIIFRSIKIALHNLSKASVINSDIILNPDTSKCINGLPLRKYFEPEVIKELIKIGEKEAKKALPDILKLIEK